MPISGFDHVALPTSHPEEMLAFYEGLGFVAPDFQEWRKSGTPYFSVGIGSQKINFHAPSLWQNPDFELRGPSAKPGCGDLCFVWRGDSASLQSALEGVGAAVIAGPVVLQGARGTGTSIYIRDPDANLLEFIVYDEE